MEPIHLKFRYTEADWVAAMRLHFRQTLKLRRDLAAAIVIGFLGFAFGASYGFTMLLPWVLAGGAALVVLLVAAAWYVVPGWSFQRSPKLHDEYDLLFSEEGIDFRIAHVGSKFDWTRYRGYLADESCWLLYYGKATFTAIPKRLFPTAEDAQGFAQLIQRKLSPA